MVMPELSEVLANARVVSIPLRTRFRGLTEREAVVFAGAQGWTEFSPFAEYDDAEAAAWLRAAYEFGWDPLPPLYRSTIPVNATVPAVDPDEVERVLAGFGPCRTVKVKVAQPMQTLSEDVARVARVRELLGAEGRLRIDANGAWNIDEAEHAIHALAEYDLEYVEQPCATIAELSEIRSRVKYMDIPIAADESVRKESDPLEVARAGAANLLVLKVQPLGGIRNSMTIADTAGLPVVVSSALDTSIGLAMGAHLAAALPTLEFDCGLGTAALLAGDVVTQPLIPLDGHIPVSRPEVDEHALARFAASPERTQWWLDRLTRVHALV